MYKEKRILKDILKDLRQKMKDRTMEAYIIPSSDPHNSEYLSDYYKSVEFISGFTWIKMERLNDFWKAWFSGQTADILYGENCETN